MNTASQDRSLSVIIPVFNDEAVLAELHRRLKPTLETITSRAEVLFVDDGSSDGSLRVLEEIRSRDSRVKVVQLTRNFGQPNAIAAGLDLAGGEVVIIMDSDLQDRPEDIPRLIDALDANNVPLAIARWTSRGDSPVKIAASRLFNALSNRITSVQFPRRIRAFRAMSRELVEELKRFPERTATPFGLLSWLGCEYVLVDLDRDARQAGSSGYTIPRMMKLSLDRIFSFSLLPIRLASIMGVLLGTCSVLLAIYFVLQKLFFREILPGWTSIVVISLFLLGMNFIFIGILGEYLGRIYMEVKQRPRYVIRRILGPDQGGGE